MSTSKRRAENQEASLFTTKKQKFEINKINSRYVCPLTNEQFKDPYVFGDGWTYEKESLLKWISENKNTIQGPTGFPLLTKIYSPNEILKNWLETDKKQRGEGEGEEEAHVECDITQEKIKESVLLLPRSDWKESKVAYRNYERISLKDALNKTWKVYDIARSEWYFNNEKEHTQDHQILDLNQTHVLVPNFIFWKEAPSATYSRTPFTLPMRAPAPRFDETRVDMNSYENAIVDSKFDDGLSANPIRAQYNFMSNIAVPCSILDSSTHQTSNILAQNWIITCHGKFLVFKNCLFKDCIFKNICWCAIRFVQCKFVRCIFIHCRLQTAQNNFNCIFEQCVCLNSTDNRNKLLGTCSYPQLARTNERNLTFVETTPEQ